MDNTDKKIEINADGDIEITDFTNQPNFNMDDSDIPDIRIKTIRFKNFKVFEDYALDFTKEEACKSFACFIGPNGCGKTTILDGIQNLFSNFESYDATRLKALLGKAVRHVDGDNRGGVHGDDDFIIEADLACSKGDYSVSLSKQGFIKEHPDYAKELLMRICFYARFDQELHQFQIAREKWPMFQDLFSSVTGFKVEEAPDLFYDSQSARYAKVAEQYVLGFLVHKPNETISHKECSAGEKKIIKCFSTLLSKEYTPKIILVDNVAMHIESGRHLQMIEAIKRCFPISQIFATTHSYQISRNLGSKDELYDLRFIKVNDVLQNQPWRLYCIDEMRDAISKLSAMERSGMIANTLMDGERLLERCENDTDSLDLPVQIGKFLGKVSGLFVRDIFNYYNQ